MLWVVALAGPRDAQGTGPTREGRVPSVTSSLMSVSTAVFSDSLRQMLSRGFSLLLVTAAGVLSMEHNPGLPWGESPSRDVAGVFFSPHLPHSGCSPPFRHLCSGADPPYLHPNSSEPGVRPQRSPCGGFSALSALLKGLYCRTPTGCPRAWYPKRHT